MIINGRRYFTSESVTEGHPDKMCDQISDAILDAILSSDPNAHVACETITANGLVLVMGEICTECYVDIPAVVRSTVEKIGYNRAKYGFDAHTCAVITAINEQSPDIAEAVKHSYEIMNNLAADDRYNLVGAGDQGMVFGFACDETAELMPMPIMLAHGLAKKLSEARKNNVLDFLRPDGKTQVTVEYENDIPVRVDTVIVSAQHAPDVSQEEIRKGIITHVVESVIPSHLLRDTRILINPSGKFEVGGPKADSGLTGRKIIVDTYGGYCAHGGGAFSGKDATKVDRSGAYMARYACKNMVAAGLAKKIELQVSYAIGVANPVSFAVNSFGTGAVSDGEIERIIRESFDFRPAAIIDFLGLRRPIYKPTAAYGHFGRNEFSWEQLDKTFIEKYKK